MKKVFSLNNFSNKGLLISDLLMKKNSELKSICLQLQIDLKNKCKKKHNLIEYIVNQYIKKIEKKNIPSAKINIKFVNGDVCSIKGKRQYMEDTYVYSEYDDIKLFGVFDGHSGSEISDILPVFISKVLFKRLLNAVRYNSKKVKKIVKNSFLDIDNFIETQFSINESGSTACLCLQIKNDFYKFT